MYLLSRATESDTILSIAVLPLGMRRRDPDADYLSYGIAASINNSLARLPGLKVIPNSVALRLESSFCSWARARKR